MPLHPLAPIPNTSCRKGKGGCATTLSSNSTDSRDWILRETHCKGDYLISLMPRSSASSSQRATTRPILRASHPISQGEFGAALLWQNAHSSSSILPAVFSVERDALLLCTDSRAGGLCDSGDCRMTTEGVVTGRNAGVRAEPLPA